jgi:hypothetical protein
MKSLKLSGRVTHHHTRSSPFSNGVAFDWDFLSAAASPWFAAKLGEIKAYLVKADTDNKHGKLNAVLDIEVDGAPDRMVLAKCTEEEVATFQVMVAEMYLELAKIGLAKAKASAKGA